MWGGCAGVKIPFSKRGQPMNRILWLVVNIILFSVLVSADVEAQQTIWVSSPNAKIKSEKGASSTTVAILEMGTALSVISTKGRWYQVETASGETGWIYRGKVSNIRPETAETQNKGDSLDSLFGGLTGSSIRADTSDTSRSIRGLSPEAQAYAKTRKTPEKYQYALDKTLSIEIIDKEIEHFLREGRIGEYAE
jgi:uncharacterized protein YgiM (DUF1202 family)